MNEYTSKGGVARSHSDNGNLKDNGKHTFVYDYKNRLIGAFDKATGNPTAAYLYYCDNRRAKKIVYSQASPGQVQSQERYFYDGSQVVEETDDPGNTLLTWVYSPVYVDEPVQMVRTGTHSLGAGTFYLHQNARADVVAVTDAAGAVVERRLFDDYGRSFDGVTKQVVSGSAVGNVYGFQGRRLDSETGLLYFRARYYDPATGRFVQRDPVWDPGNFGNQYSFVGNGPVSTTDPEGLAPNKDDHHLFPRWFANKKTNPYKKNIWKDLFGGEKWHDRYTLRITKRQHRWLHMKKDGGFDWSGKWRELFDCDSFKKATKAQQKEMALKHMLHLTEWANQRYAKRIGKPDFKLLSLENLRVYQSKVSSARDFADELKRGVASPRGKKWLTETGARGGGRLTETLGKSTKVFLKSVVGIGVGLALWKQSGADAANSLLTDKGFKLHYRNVVAAAGKGSSQRIAAERAFRRYLRSKAFEVAGKLPGSPGPNKVMAEDFFKHASDKLFGRQ